MREDVATELGVLVLRFERCFVGGTLRRVCHDGCHLLRDGGELLVCRANSSAEKGLVRGLQICEVYCVCFIFL